jgi:hypothetical protein
MRRLRDSTIVAKVGEIVECLDAWNKEIGTALHGREGRKALHPLSDRTLWDCKIKRAVLGANDGIVLVAKLLEYRIVDPYVLSELELANETCADHKRSNFPDFSLENAMKKISMIGATLMVAAMLSAAPISLQSHDKGLSLFQDRANARLGRPLTPVSVAGVHRRAVRRCARGVTC